MVKTKLKELDLSFYERRLDAIGALLDREIQTILIHLAYEKLLPSLPVSFGLNR